MQMCLSMLDKLLFLQQNATMFNLDALAKGNFVIYSKYVAHKLAADRGQQAQSANQSKK